MSAEPADGDLLERLRKGDERAFTLLYRRWQGRLFRFALRMSGSHGLAEDATHEVFMALIRGSNGFDPSLGPLAPYLYGMTRNQVRRRLERDRAHVFTGQALAEEPAGGDDPLAQLALKEAVDALRHAVLALPDHYREAVVLCDLDQLSYQDAAAALGCAVGTIRSRLHRGRELLASKLRSRRGPAPGEPR